MVNYDFTEEQFNEDFDKETRSFILSAKNAWNFQNMILNAYNQKMKNKQDDFIA